MFRQPVLATPGGGAPTLAAAVMPATRSRAQAGLRAVLLVVLFSVLIALSAQVSIYLPITPVPITLQTLMVLVTGAALGWRLGGMALLTYVAEGLAGLPVFAGGNSAWSGMNVLGVPWIVGPTSGYVVGFVFAAVLLGYLAERGWDRSVPLMALGMVLGTAAIYVFGVAELSRYVPWPGTLAAGVVPFLPGDALKVVVAAVVLPGGWALLGRPWAASGTMPPAGVPGRRFNRGR